MKKQTALLLSTLVLMSAVSMQPAHAFKFYHKKAKPAVAAPAKNELVPVKSVVKEETVKKETPAVKVAPAVTSKPAIKPAAPAAVPVKPVQKAAPKAPVKK